MKKYQVKIDSDALADIQNITNWYNEAQSGLGKRFQDTAIKQITSLGKDPQIYAVRYKDIRCMIVKKSHTWCIFILTKKTILLRY